MNPSTKFPSRRLLALGALLLAAGCRPEERMVWSPDGSRAAVIRPDGVVLMKPDGACSAPLASDVTSAAWTPDGRSLVLTRTWAVSNWTDAAASLPAGERTAVEAVARGLPELIRGLLAMSDGSLETAVERFSTPPDFPEQDVLLPAALCLWERDPEALRRALAAAKDGEKTLKDLEKDHAYTLHEIARLDLDGDRPAGGRRIVSSLTDLGRVRLAPRGGRFAYTQRDTLWVAALADPTNSAKIAGPVAGLFSWTRDGAALAYAAPAGEQWSASGINLAQIMLAEVATGTNGLPTAGTVRPLALAACAFPPRVEVLPDGRVLFASLAMSLPAGASSPGDAEARLYLIDPASSNAAPVAIPSAAGALPQELAFFVPSPDGRRIAVVESRADTVAVLDRATGALEVASPPGGRKCRTLPSWRGTNELFFAALPTADARRPEWMRWSGKGTPGAVSKDWPDSAVGSLLEN